MPSSWVSGYSPESTKYASSTPAKYPPSASIASRNSTARSLSSRTRSLSSGFSRSTFTISRRPSMPTSDCFAVFTAAMLL